MQFSRFHRRDYEFSSDPSSTKVGKYGYRYDVSFSDHTKASEIGEPKLEAAHYISDNPVVALCNDESLRTALVDLHEKVCTVVFWKTDPVYLDDRRKIIRPKRPKKIGRFQQLASALEENL